MGKKILFYFFVLLNGFSYGGEPIKIGVSAVFSGPSQALGTNYFYGARLYFKQINEKGGIQGRKIQMIKLDDTYNPQPCIANTIQLIGEKKVDLLFNYVGTPTTTAILPLLKIYEKEKIILFGNFTGAGGQRNYPYKEYVFNIRASYKEETAKLVQYFLANDYQRIGVYYQIDSYGRSGYDGVKQELYKSGKRISAEATYLRGSLYEDSTSEQALHLKKKKVDVVICVGSYQACAAFVRDARNNGLNVPIANISFVGTESMLDILEKNKVSLKSLYFSEVVPYYGETSLPLIKEYLHLLEKEGATPNFISLEGFINAKVLTTILKNTSVEVSRKNIKKIIESMDAIDIGMGNKLQFTKEVHQLLHDVYLYLADEKGNLKRVSEP